MKILTHNTSIHSAMLLRDKIVALTGEHFFVSKDASTVSGKFIRYGNSDRASGGDTQFNSADFVDLCVDKEAFANLLLERGFYAPNFYSSNVGVVFPCLVRSTLTSFDGRGIIICHNQGEFNRNWRNGYYWTPFIKTQFELRVHVLGGKVVKIFKKEPTRKEKTFPIRNLRLGYNYALKDNVHYPRVIKLVNNLKNVLKGKFYTLDMGWDAMAQKYFIYEANSGSGLNNKTAELYAKFLVKKMGLKNKA